MNTTKILIHEKHAEDVQRQCCYFPKRYVFTVLGCLGLFNVYAMRVNLSVAMVAMVNHTVDASYNGSHPVVIECPNLVTQETTGESEKFVGEQYNWDAKKQGLILGAFFYGYILTQIPGGFISEKFGAKWLFGVGVFITAIFSLLTPLAARWGVVPFVVVRVIEGLGEGVTYPAINFLISRWSPKLERSRVSTIVFMGAQLGNVVSMPISGWLSSSDLFGGWPSVFYVFGVLGCIWFIFWTFLIYETPSEHPSIAKRELKYFQMDNEETPQKSKTPWKAIFTSVPMWAVMISHFGHNFGFIILLTELPTYLSTILHFNVKDNGLLSALPYIVQALSAYAVSYIADRLRRTKRLSITSIRKLCNCIGMYGPAVCILAVTVAGCSPKLIVALFSLGMALNGFIFSGFNVTHLDMSPDFAGTSFAITNAFANMCGIIGPAVVGAFTDSGATRSNWSNVFYITAAVYTVTGTFYAVFASAEPQPWGEGIKKTADKPVKDKKSVDSKG